MPVCVFHSQEITFTFLSNRQSRSYPCELLSPHITQPPIRSNDEWGGSLLDRIFQYLLPLAFFGLPFGCWGNIWGIENSGYLPIRKTSGTRRRLLWSLPKYSRVAHPSEKCFVFGNLPELCLL